jgi:hypothetical protein
MDLLHTILIEADKTPSEDPNKMLVHNKKSGAAYYIDRHNFDSNIHQKADGKRKKTTEDKPSGGGKKKKSGGGGGGKFSLGGAAAKEAEKETPDAKDEKEKKTPDQELQDKIGSPVLVDKNQREKIQHDAYSMRPDLKEKLLSFEYDSIFKEYNELSQNGGTTNDIKLIARKLQRIAIAKFSALALKSNDMLTTHYAKIYKTYEKDINDMLRKGEKIISKEELEQEMDQQGIPKELLVLLNVNYAVHALDDHYKMQGSVLQNDVTVYRAIGNDIVDKFIQAKTWIDNGFVSTSLNPLITLDITDKEILTKKLTIIQMKLLRGNRVLMLPCKDDPFCIESEIILPRGCKFTMEDAVTKNNLIVYNVTVEFPHA